MSRLPRRQRQQEPRSGWPTKPLDGQLRVLDLLGRQGEAKVASDRHKLNTSSVALVEAKRDIPWTKPEDISYQTDKPLPTLGGWFPGGWLARMADGSVQFVSFDNDEEDIRNLFTINDGKSVTINGTIQYERGASR